MKTQKNLSSRLNEIDGKGYKAYKEIKGEYDFDTFILIIDHVQGDPFAVPSRIRVRIDREKSGFHADTTLNKSRHIGLCDFLTRVFFENCRKLSKGGRGSGKSGLIVMDRPVQEMLPRSAVVINDSFLEARFFMGLPAFGRKIAGEIASDMFMKELPEIINCSLFMNVLDRESVYHHIKTAEDADFLREELSRKGLVSFIAEGAFLPRASGINPEPMDKKKIIPFRAPDTYSIDITLPNKGKISGMGIPEGVTLIVGGGYHGKSTLLNAIEFGIYNHIPGDGREYAISLSDTLKVRASDGRSIEKTDISPFITNLPFKKDTKAFSTQNASGSTSQAATISEGIEAGARVLLLDEDTSATNFMIRDRLMQELVEKKHEPITPFIDKVRQLYIEKKISTIIVIGGSGEYFNVADHIIQMKEYLPVDVTEKAHQIIKQSPLKRKKEGADTFGFISERIPLKTSFSPLRADGKTKISADGCRGIFFGKDLIDMGDIEQIVTESQTRAIGYAIHLAMSYMDGEKTMREIVDTVIQSIEDRGMDILTPYITGDLAGFRKIELASAINRMRRLHIRQKNYSRL
ncbi:MAG: ABC-ATPase domain-containing protein [Proteobacteria bacterium]|nr:ABC-ATPase domain-containing protein [Pseudomonadota bacterium]